MSDYNAVDVSLNVEWGDVEDIWNSLSSEEKKELLIKYGSSEEIKWKLQMKKTYMNIKQSLQKYMRNE